MQSFQPAMPAPVEEYFNQSDGTTVHWSIDPTPKNKDGSVHAIFYKLSLSIRKPGSTTWGQENDYDVPIDEVTTISAANEQQVDKAKVRQFLSKEFKIGGRIFAAIADGLFGSHPGG